MPIRKDVNGVIQYTEKVDKFEADTTGVNQSGSFFVADDNDQLKQVKIDPSEQATNTTVVLKTKAASANSTVTITFPDVDTTISSGSASNSFSIIQPDAGTSPTATSATDTLTLTSSTSELTITGNSGTDTVDFTAPALVKLAGRAGGQVVYGGTAASDPLELYSTSNATKGIVKLGQNYKEFATGVVAVGPDNGFTPLSPANVTLRTSSSGSIAFEHSSGQPWFVYPTTGNVQFTSYPPTKIGFALDTSSRFFVGDGAPISRMCVSETSTTTSVGALSSTSPVIEVRNRSTTTDNFSGVVFEGSGTDWDVGLIAVHNVHTAAAQTGYLEIWAATAGARAKTLTAKTSGITHGTGVSYPITTKTSAYTILDTDYLIIADASGGAFTTTLPTAVGRAGKVFVVKRINAGATVTIGTTSSELIDNATTEALGSRWQSRTVISNGTQWFLI